MRCDFMSLGKVLNDFYVVPEYQRDYVWRQDDVTTLLEDIRSNIDLKTPPNLSDQYFIGSIVVFQDNVSSPYLLIDGQQRLTTIFLILCAIKNQIEKLGESAPQNLKDTIYKTTDNDYGEDVDTYRVELNEEANQQLLIEAYQGTLTSRKNQRELTTSQKNIIRASSSITEFLEKNYDSKPELVRFGKELRQQVGMVRIVADDLYKAMVVFETINDRGVGLDSFDLLKNLLYRELGPNADTTELSNTWTRIKQNLSDVETKPMRFLRYFVASTDKSLDGRPPAEKSTFAWFQNEQNKLNHEIDRKPIQFAHRIEKVSWRYRMFLHQHVNHYGNRSSGLNSLNVLGGYSTRQHIGLLLTAADKGSSSEAFELLCNVIESMLFYSFARKIRSQTLESLISRWMKLLQSFVNLGVEEVTKLALTVKDDLQTQYNEFYADFDQFGENTFSQRYRQKYVLAKFLQHSEKENRSSDFEYLSSLTGDGKLEIEHVFPQTPSESALAEFSDGIDLNSEDQLDVTKLFGNMLLMEGSLQKSCSNKPYSEKKEKYESSQFWMVKKFARKHPQGPLNLMNSLSSWPTHETWTTAELSRRQEQYKSIAKKIWNFGLDS